MSTFGESVQSKLKEWSKSTTLRIAVVVVLFVSGIIFTKVVILSQKTDSSNNSNDATDATCSSQLILVNSTNASDLSTLSDSTTNNIGGISEINVRLDSSCSSASSVCFEAYVNGEKTWSSSDSKIPFYIANPDNSDTVATWSPSTESDIRLIATVFDGASCQGNQVDELQVNLNTTAEASL